MSKVRQFFKLTWVAWQSLVDLLLDGAMPMECGACSRLNSERGFCARCRNSMKSTKGSADVRVFYEYSGALKTALQRAKFNRDSLSIRALADLFERSFVQSADPSLASPDVIVFVSSPFWRRAHRGFDLSAIFANRAGQILGVPVVDALLPRARAPLSHSASAEERARCVKDAFTLKKWDSVLGKRVLLIDDVRTSGVTLAEVTRVLLDGGAASVMSSCLAQTP